MVGRAQVAQVAQNQVWATWATRVVGGPAQGHLPYRGVARVGHLLCGRAGLNDNERTLRARWATWRAQNNNR